MHDGQVTSPTTPHVTPVLYLDLDIAPSHFTSDEDLVTQSREVCGITPYPGLRALLLTAHGPGGNGTIPVYRIEGPLPQLIKWLQAQYGADSPGNEPASFWLERAGLAR
jgi:hypothetical protein